MEYTSRKYLYLYFALSVLLMLFLFFRSHSIVYIDIQASSKPTIYFSKLGGDGREGISNGLHILPTGDYFMEATAGNAAVAKNLNIRPVFTPAIRLAIKPQKQAQHVARATGDCLFGDINNYKKGEVVSYNCDPPQTVTRNIYDTYSKRSVLYETYMEQPTPYKDGLIGLVDGDAGIYLVTADANSTTNVALGKHLKSGLLSYRLAVNNNTLYLLDTERSELLVFSSPSAKPNVIDVSSATINEYSVLGISNQHITITSPLDIPEESDTGKEAAVSLFNKSGRYIFSQDFKDGLDTMHPINERFFYAATPESLHIFELNGSKFKLQQSIPKVVDTLHINGTLYIVIDGGVYTYNPSDQSLGLIFKASSVTITQLTNISNTLTMTGFSLNENNPANQVYVLGTQEQPIDKPRLEDKVPYGDKNSSAAWMDYFGDQAHIAIELLSSRVDPSSGQLIINEVELREKQNSIEDQLVRDGLSGRFKFTYSQY